MKTPVKSVALLCLAAALRCHGADAENSKVTPAGDLLTLTPAPSENVAQQAPQVQITLDDDKSGTVSLKADKLIVAPKTALTTTTFLGVGVAEVSSDIAAQLPIEPGCGLLVLSNVSPDSPAAQAGLQANDVLTKIDDQLLVSPKQLQMLVHRKKPGDKVEITFLRKGETKTATATLGAHQESASAQIQISENNTLSYLGNQLTPGTILKQIVVLDKYGKVTSVSEMGMETRGALAKLEKMAELIEAEKMNPAMAPSIRDAIKTLRSKLVSEAAAEGSPSVAPVK